MARYLVRRFLVAIPTIFITISLIFFILRVLPGDAALVVLGDNASEKALENLRIQMGLNVPIWQQYIVFLGDIFKGDLGVSIASGTPVSELIADNFGHTMLLTLASILIGCMIGVPLGVFSALRPNSWIDNLVRAISMTWISVPPFLMGIILILAFSLKIELFPSMGVGEGLWKGIYHLALPAFTLGLILSGVMMRFARASMLDELNQDYIRTAKAKGIPSYIVIFKHALRNSLIPVITVIGLDITALISGAVITESIFSRPGLGSLAIDAIITRDFAVLQGCLILVAFLVVIVNLIVDISYSIANPKIRPS
ncbi:ABC transporter permease [Peribacillus frigoritolerans]|uniref:ABC transporter permease n=1 Tax=Peribacillus frigoritolerans TaxID=450367 RepID=UPI00227F2309|nr:ABC transporter permease [Peribacillus frigoritolerans]MCY9002417.1 ABC transporter permease [Peribacillus frigoritolerans]